MKKKHQEAPSLKKQYLKSRPVCKVSFRLPAQAVGNSDTVSVTGDFNEWNPKNDPMKRLKNGDFTLVKELPIGREYRFRYLIDHHRWENDSHADRYTPNPYGTEDSVVVV